MKKLAWSLSLIGLLGFFLTSSIHWPIEREIVKQDCQPPSINYRSFDPYCVGIVKESYVFLREGEIRVVKSGDSLLRGYGTEFHSILNSCSASDYTFEWSHDGLSISVLDGAQNSYKIIVPAKAIIGSR